jgi:hypothetical protein
LHGSLHGVEFCIVLGDSFNKDFPCRTMVRTRVREAASSSARLRPCRALLQDAQDLESESKVIMEDVEVDDAAGSGSHSGGPIKEASTTTDEEDNHLVY